LGVNKKEKSKIAVAIELNYFFIHEFLITFECKQEETMLTLLNRATHRGNSNIVDCVEYVHSSIVGAYYSTTYDRNIKSSHYNKVQIRYGVCEDFFLYNRIYNISQLNYSVYKEYNPILNTYRYTQYWGKNSITRNKLMKITFILYIVEKLKISMKKRSLNILYYIYIPILIYEINILCILLM